jgi:hypothetical protein
MDEPFSTETQQSSSPELDPRLRPTPDYGTLGPGSDVPNLGTGSQGVPAPRQSARVASIIAGLVGVFAALLVSGIGRAHTTFPAIQKFFSTEQDQPAESKGLRQIDSMRAQKQAEALLERAVAQDSGATEQISSRVDRWQGKLQWNSHMASLTTAALNSGDMRVREAGVEVELAAYGLQKNSASLEYLLRMSQSPDHAQKIWALWSARTHRQSWS